MRLADRPFGMQFVKVAGGINHFGFEPDAETDAAQVRLRRKIRKSVRQTVRVHLPVAKTGSVIRARVTVAEPAVVQ